MGASSTAAFGVLGCRPDRYEFVDRGHWRQRCAALDQNNGATQQTFVNQKDGPIYVSVEPWPQCFELEPGDRLTLMWDGPATGDAIQTDFINERELVVWPNGSIDGIRYLINGEPCEDRSWTFKHR